MYDNLIKSQRIKQRVPTEILARFHALKLNPQVECASYVYGILRGVGLSPRRGGEFLIVPWVFYDSVGFLKGFPNKKTLGCIEVLEVTNLYTVGLPPTQ